MTMVMTTVVSWVSEGCSGHFMSIALCKTHGSLPLSCSTGANRAAADIRTCTQPAWLHVITCCPLHPCTLRLQRCFWYTPGQSVNDRFTKFTSLSRELGVSDGGFPSQDYVPGNWLVDVPPCSYPTAAVLCWFSRTRTDPLCSSGTPGLMLHRTLELVSAQI